MERQLTKKEFDILAAMTDSEARMTQRAIAEATGCSLGAVNKVYNELSHKGYIAEGRITHAGLEALEPYRVRRAVFLAAGFGSRLIPVTLNTPKALVRVRGKRLIDGLLDACLAAGIEELYIVRGYLAEEFDCLTDKYPMVRFVENPVYNEAKNISSALQVRDRLSNAYVFEADLYLSDPSIIKKYHYRSNFLAIKKARTDDWCFEVKDGVITREKIGGLNAWQMVGISYWDSEDGEKLYGDIKEAFEMPGGKELYWEQVPLKVFRDKYRVAVRECFDGDVTELDTFNELKRLDPSYDM